MRSSHTKSQQSQQSVIHWNDLPKEMKEFIQAMADTGIPFEIEQNGQRLLLIVERIVKERPVDDPIVVPGQT